MSRISEAKERLDNFRASNSARKKVEYEEASAMVRINLYQAIWDAYDAGTTIAQISREYGSTDRATIYRIINKRDELTYAAPKIDPAVTVQPDADARSDGFPAALRVHVDHWTDWSPAAQSAAAQTGGVYTGGVTVYPAGDGVRFVPESIDHFGGPLQAEILAWDDNSEIVQAIKREVEMTETFVVGDRVTVTNRTGEGTLLNNYGDGWNVLFDTEPRRPASYPGWYYQDDQLTHVTTTKGDIVATATKTTREVTETRTITETVKVPTITLELSQEEAQTLADIMDFVRGSTTRSRRKHSDSVGRALHEAGVVPADPKTDVERPTSGFYFKDSL